MGKSTGFLDYSRVDCPERPPESRIKDFGQFHRPLPERQRQRQAGRCMDCGVPFCQAGIVFDGKRLGCPLHNLIPEWNDLVWLNNPSLALDRLTKTNCFPEFTGRVCPALCERACTCNMAGFEPVTVRDNELYIIESAFENGLMTPKPPKKRSGRTVAVVGSGPAGLAAGYTLNRRGHSVTIFERDNEPGGLLMYGIPGMKLPKEVVRRRIRLMEAEGVVFKTSVDVFKDLPLEELQAQFDCVILCCGAQKPRQVPFEGSAQGIHYALDYLRSDSLSAKGKAVAVIGNGDSASDCIATALRQGCKSIVQLVRKPESYYSGETDYAHEESLALFGQDIRRFSTQVKAVIPGEDGQLTALELTSPEGEYKLDCQMLILASGFSGCEDYITATQPQWGDNIFTAGDMATGPSLVVTAIAGGKEAAARAEEYLMY